MKGIDRKGWKKVTLGEVCRNLNITERAPLEAGIERYVGLEHIEPENLHIKSWGAVADGTTFTKRFEPGQVLFGKRRAYQKKAAVADFTGICSGDILVLEAIESKVDPRLLPFVVQADQFFEYAVQTSAGSLSPRTKFQDLAKYEFMLPPKAEQARLAELLWTGDEVVEGYGEVASQLLQNYERHLDHIYTHTGNMIEVANIANINSHSLGTNTSPDFSFKYLDISAIEAPKTLGTLTETDFKNAPSRARRVVADGDIVMALVRPYFKSFVVVKDAKGIIASTGTAVLSSKSGNDRDYIFHSLFTKRFSDFCEVRMNGTSYPAITANDVKEFTVPILSYHDQMNTAAILNSIDDSLNAARHSIKLAGAVQKHLINQMFSA